MGHAVGRMPRQWRPVVCTYPGSVALSISCGPLQVVGACHLNLGAGVRAMTQSGFDRGWHPRYLAGCPAERHLGSCFLATPCASTATVLRPVFVPWCHRAVRQDSEVSSAQWTASLGEIAATLAGDNPRVSVVWPLRTTGDGPQAVDDVTHDELVE